MINKLSDIRIGCEYDFFIVKDKRRPRRAIVHAIINESVDYPDVGKTEAYVTIYYGRGKLSRNLLYASEFGIGDTREEAFLNYGRFKHEAHPSFETNAQRVIDRIIKETRIGIRSEAPVNH